MISCNLSDTYAAQLPTVLFLNECSLPTIVKKVIYDEDFLLKSSNGRDDVSLFRTQNYTLFLINKPIKNDSHEYAESLRRLGAKTAGICLQEKITSIQLVASADTEDILQIAEGMMLASYRFTKYQSQKNQHPLTYISLVSGRIKPQQIIELNHLVKAVFKARDLVNEPLSYLTASKLSEELVQIGRETNILVNVYEKTQIENLRMGGLLAVNAGSLNPPTFTIMEYKPDSFTNTHPYVLIGKGIVYDTGGLSLKPTENGMDYMKCDMAGAAAIACAIYAIALNRLPVHIIGLIPATENRPNGNAMVPGDVITMYDGTTVEALNTDAEGRLILGDALSYAKRYNPLLTIDVATLTGAAAKAIGKEGSVYMGTADLMQKKQIETAGLQVHERLVEFPLWPEYKDYIKSEIADLKNVGKAEAGAITAGMFLKHFTNYPWLHIDIAGTAFLHNADYYKPAGSTGVGVRLLYQYFKNIVQSSTP